MSFLSDAVKMTSFVLVVIVIVHVLLNKVADEDDRGVERFSDFGNPAPAMPPVVEAADRDKHYAESVRREKVQQQKKEQQQQEQAKQDPDRDELYDFVHAASSSPPPPPPTTTKQASSSVRASNPKHEGAGDGGGGAMIESVRPYSASGAFADVYEAF